MFNRLTYTLVSIFCLFFVANGQNKPITDCSMFDIYRQKAITAIQKKQFTEAINNLEAARIACPSRTHEIASLNIQIFELIETESQIYKKRARIIEYKIKELQEVNNSLQEVNNSLQKANFSLKETLDEKAKADSLLSKILIQKKVADSLLNKTLIQKALIDSLVLTYNGQLITAQNQLLETKSDRDGLKKSFIELDIKKQKTDSTLKKKYSQLKMAENNLKNLKGQIITSEDELSKIRQDRERTLNLLASTEQRSSLQMDLTKVIEHTSVLERKRQYAFLGLSIPILLGVLSAFFYSRSRKEKKLLYNRP